MRDIVNKPDLESHIRDPFAHHVNVVATGNVWIEGVPGNTGVWWEWPADQYVGIDVPFPVVSGQSILFCAYNPDAEYGTHCDQAECRIMLDDDDNIVPYDPVTGYGCKIQYKQRSNDDDWTLGISYILFGSGFLPSTAYMDEKDQYDYI